MSDYFTGNCDFIVTMMPYPQSRNAKPVMSMGRIPHGGHSIFSAKSK